MDLSFTEKIIAPKIKKIFSALGDVDVMVLTQGERIYVHYHAPHETPDKYFIGHFSLEIIDGGSNLFFGNVRLAIPYQNKGYGVKLHELRLSLAKDAGAESVIATSNKSNDSQNRIFEKFGWTRGDLNDCHYIWYKSMKNYKPKMKKG